MAIVTVLYFRLLLSICYKLSLLSMHVCYMTCFHSDAINDLALHFLSKLKIMVVTNVERDEIEFISKVS